MFKGIMSHSFQYIIFDLLLTECEKPNLKKTIEEIYRQLISNNENNNSCSLFFFFFKSINL